MIEEKYLIETLKEIVGAEEVITEASLLEKYASDGSFVRPMKPLAAVRPSTIEEVQGIVRMANRFGIALFPYSSGTTYQGAHIPTERGITLDLSRMKRIELLDTVARNAIIEPGVTFAELQKETAKVGLRVMTPIGVPSFGSVLATYLECTPLYLWPRYRTWETLTLKIVLPTGEIMGTGQMALLDSERPYNWTTNFAVLNRLFFCAQGTLGIAVKGAITLTNLPKLRKFIFIPLENIDQLGEWSQSLMHQEAHDEFLVADRIYLACLLAKDREEIEILKKEFPPWTLVIGISGREEKEIVYKEEDLNEVLNRFNLEAWEGLPGLENASIILIREIDYPQGMLNQRRYKGACNYIACMASKTQLKPFYDLVRKTFEKENKGSLEMGFLIMPLNFGGSYYFEPNLYHNPEDTGEHARCRRLFLDLSRTLIHAGGYFPRPYPLWAEEIYSRMGSYHRKVKMVKEMLDPKNVMNPGKLSLS